MSDQSATESAVSALIERIQAGEPLQEVLRPQFAPDEVATLKRAAVPRLFDRGLYDGILRSGDGPSFNALRKDPRIETIGGQPIRRRVRPNLQPSLRALWWPGERLPARPEPPPAELATLLHKLIEHYADAKDPLERLYHLAVVDEDAAIRLLHQQYRKAEARFDLAACQDVISAVGLDERPIGSRLRAEANELARSLRVRGAYATDFYRTARFFLPEGLMAEITAFLEGSPATVVQVVAEGGMGKTMRMRWFIARKCITDGIPVARIDFDDADPVVVGTDPWLVLLEFALQLHDQLPGTPFDKLAADFSEFRPLLRRGTSPDGGSRGGVDLQAIRQRAESEVPKRVRAGLAESAADRTIVLILDTTEELILPVERNVSGLWRDLRALLDERPRMRLILAGRYDLALRSTAYRTSFPDASVREVEPFSDEHAEAYLRSRGIEDRDLVREIVRQSGGRPFKLALFGDIVQQRPDLTAADVAAYTAPDLLFLVERVLDRIPDRGVRWLLRYGVIPRWLTLEVARDVLEPYLARAMAGDPAFDDPRDDQMPATRRLGEATFPTDIPPDEELSIDLLWETLRDYADTASWVSMDGEALRFQPEVVEPMREVLRDRPAWPILHGSAADWFEGRAAGEPDQWGERIAEAAYHRFQRDGEAAVPWWQDQLERAWTLARTDWVRRLAEVAPRTGDREADLGSGGPDASPPALVPGSTVVAEFHLAAIEIIDASRREAPPTDSGWAAAQHRLDRAVSLDNGRGLIPAARLSLIRATVAYRQGDTQGALDQIALGRRLSQSDVDASAFATLYAEILVGTGSPESEEATSQALTGLAGLIRRGEPVLRGTVAASIIGLASIELRNDRIAESIAVYEAGRDMLGADRSLAIEFGLRAADVEARWCRPGAALARFDAVAWDSDAVQMLRREVIRGRAEAAAGRPTEAIQAVAGVLDALSTEMVISLELDATAHEVRGQAMGALMLHAGALDDLDVARGRWRARLDPEGVGRTLVEAATLQLRRRGDLTQARQFLDGLQSSPPPVGGDAWTDGQLRRAEWYARTGDRGRAIEIVDETLRSLDATPARRVRATLMGLAFGTETDRSREVTTLTDALRSVGQGSIRLAFLEDIEMVPSLETELEKGELENLRDLATTDGLTAPIDEALAELRIVEVERITGGRDAALERLRGLVGRLQRLKAWGALDRAIDAALRLDDPDLALEVGKNVASGEGSSPEVRASQVARLAPAAIDRGRLDEAQAMLAEIEKVLTDDPRSATAARLLVARASLARLRGAPVDAWNALHVAADTYRALGDTVAAADLDAAIRDADEAAQTSSGDDVEPETVDPGTAIEGAPVRITIEVKGAELEVSVHVRSAAAQEGVATAVGRRRLADAVGIVGLLENPDASPERVFLDVMARLASDWRAYGVDLGSLMTAAGLGAVLDGPGAPAQLSIETMHHLLAPIPWELASFASSGPVVLDPRVSLFFRAAPSRTDGVETVRYAQATLGRVLGVAAVADGILGPQTQDLLRTFQREAGLPDHGRVDEATLAALRRRALESDAFPPRAVVVRTGFDRQVQSQSVGYESTFGVDLYRLYEAAGYRTELLEQPNIGALASYTSDPTTAIVHLAAGIRLTSAGIVSLDFGDTFSKRSVDESEWTASLVGRALTRSGEGPLVVVDVPRPSSPSEAARQLVLRNKFAADLFELLSTSAVLATGLMAEATADSHDALLSQLRAGESIGAACAAARRVSAPGSDATEGLPDVAAAAAIALFAMTSSAGIGIGRAAK